MKESLIYFIYKKLPKSKEEQGELIIRVDYKTKKQNREQLSFTWSCNLTGEEDPGWHACHLNRDPLLEDSLELRALLQSIKEAGINADSEVEDVISFLHENNIEQAIRTWLDDGEKLIFDGYIAATELIAGEFDRADFEFLLLLPAELQTELLNQLIQERNIKISLPDGFPT